MSKNNYPNYLHLKGKTRTTVIGIMGQNYLPKSREDILLYIVGKTWFNRRGYVVQIEFNEEGEVDTIYMHKNYEFR